jgi:hypothetical protein
MTNGSTLHQKISQDLALDQENNRQSPNRLKKTHDFHIRVLLLKSVTG